MQMERERGRVPFFEREQGAVDSLLRRAKGTMASRALAGVLQSLGVPSDPRPILGASGGAFPTLEAGSSLLSMLHEAIADRTERGAESFLLIALREAVADQVERYIALLDLIDGDPDLEPELDEPDADIEGRAW